MTTQQPVVLCVQDLKDPAEGFLEDYLPPEEADPTHPGLAAGWHERAPQCRRHLDEHRKAMIRGGIPPERIKELPIDEYIKRHPERFVRTEQEL